MLVAAGSMREFFRENLTEALKKTSTKLTDTAQVYLVNLLVDFMRAENVYAGVDPGERPVLVDLYQRAQEAEPQEAVRIFKHMGDQSLYLTGFFTEAVNSVEYYVSMGGSAYASVAGLTRPSTSSALFTELSDRFPQLVDLLNAMSLSAPSDGPSSTKLLGLVDRFARTGDKKVLDALKSQGIVLPDDEVN
jgi:hypothetical protein